MSEDLERLIKLNRERFENRVEEYSKIILRGVAFDGNTPYDYVRIQEVAVGWAMAIILAGSIWGIDGPLKKLDKHWSRNEQADAVEKWILDWRCGIETTLTEKLQETHRQPGITLQPYEETRAFKKITEIISQVINKNPVLADTIHKG